MAEVLSTQLPLELLVRLDYAERETGQRKITIVNRVVAELLAAYRDNANSLDGLVPAVPAGGEARSVRIDGRLAAALRAVAAHEDRSLRALVAAALARLPEAPVGFQADQRPGPDEVDQLLAAALDERRTAAAPSGKRAKKAVKKAPPKKPVKKAPASTGAGPARRSRLGSIADLGRDPLDRAAEADAGEGS
jgi:hypothetical protein